MQTTKLIALIMAAAVMLCTTSARARLISYEGCDYDVTNNVNGLNGGTGWQAGWAWNWGAGARHWQVVEPGLTYADGTTNLAVKGRAFRGSYNAWDQCTRKPSQAEFGHLISNGFFGKVGTTNWFGFLVRFSGGAVTGGNFGFTLRQPDHFGEKVWLGMRYGITNLYTGGGWGAAYSPYPNTVLAPDQTMFLVTRFVYGDYNAGMMHVSLWGNPSLAGEPSVATAVTNYWSMTYDASGIKSRMWDQISLVANAGTLATGLWYYLDEMRLGETFRDVAPRDFDLSPVNRPVNVAPANGAQNVALPATLQGSAFSSDPGDVHEQTKITLRSDNGVMTVVNTGALTQVALGAGVLRGATKYTWSIQYKGTNSPVFSDPSAETTFSTAPDGTPALIAYEGCTYEPAPFPSDIAGQEGGSGWMAPWEGTWVAAGLMRVVADSPGLFYQFGATPEYLLVTNFRFRTTERGKNYAGGTEERILASSRATRHIGTDGGLNLVTPSNTYGKIGTTNWFSFLARYESGDTSQRYGISLNVGYDGNVPYQFFMGKPVGESTWGIMGKGGTVVGSSGVDATDGNTAFLVTRVIYGNPDDTVHMWVNPQARTQPLAAQASLSNAVPHFEFDYLDIMSLGGAEAPRVGIDEVRMGTDWEAVMPAGPPPPKFVGTPTNVAPADAAVNVPVTPVIQASAFNGAGENDLHIGSEFKFNSLGGAERLVATGGLTTVELPADILNSSTRYAWQVRYLDTNNSVWSEWSVPTTFTTAQGVPRLLAYEGAAYVPTNRIGGRTGGWGWSSVWQEQVWDTLPPGTYYNTQVAVEETGLEYADLVVTNNRFVTSPNAWTYGDWGNTTEAPFSRNRRVIGLDGNMHLVNANNTFGKPGTTNWVSFLARFESGTPEEYGIDFAINNNGNDIGLLAVGRVPATTTWGAWVPGTSLQVSTTNDATSGTAFLVTRLISGATEDTLHLWVNPSLGAEPPAANAVELASIPHIEFDRLGLRASGSPAPFASLDELRLGETWESVTPIIPEPALLLALAALALLRRR